MGTMDFLSEQARDTLRMLAEQVLESQGDINSLVDDDMGPLALQDEEKAELTAQELTEATEAGVLWVEDGIHYLSEDAVAELTGERPLVIGEFPGGHGVLAKYDDVLFDGGEGLRVGWVASIPADWKPGGLITVIDDRGHDWNIYPTDIAEFRG